MLAITFMFPDDSFDVTPFHPLDHTAIRTKVLLPEASTLLIQQDLPHLDRKSAIRTIQNSQQFGAEMHPGEDSVQRLAASCTDTTPTGVLPPSLSSARPIPGLAQVRRAS